MSPVSTDEKQYLIEKLSDFIDQQARRKFLQQIQYQSHLQQYQQQEQPQEIPGPGFSFELPPTLIKSNNDNEEIQFAVPPFDSRYYEQIPLLVENDDDDDDNIAVDEVPVETETATTAKSNKAVVETKNKILIPSPMHVLDSQSNDLNSRILHRAQQKQQQSQLQKNQRQENDVLQKPMQVDFDNTTSLYIVALIAGLSCAFSTGVIILLILAMRSFDNF